MNCPIALVKPLDVAVVIASAPYGFSVILCIVLLRIVNNKVIH